MRLLLVAWASLAAACGCAAGPTATGPWLQQTGAREATVLWRTEEPAIGRVAWSADPAGPPRVVVEASPRRLHAVRLSDLPAGAGIRYRVEPLDRDVDPAWMRWAVPTAGGGALRFLVLGDSGAGNAAQRAVAAVLLDLAAREGPFDLLLHLGDIAYESGTVEELVQRFFHVYEPLLASTVVWPAPGNHDVRTGRPTEEIGPWFEHFVLPRGGEVGGVPSGRESYYAFDRGPAHFVVLDTSVDPIEPGGEMLRWLEADLAANDRPWTVVALHHPPYSDGSHDSDRDARMTRVRERVVPILERHSVDLVLGGHSHAYERTALLAGAWETPSAPGDHVIDAEAPYEKRPGPLGGTVYVVAGHGGRRTEGRLEHPLVVAASLAHGFLVVEIDGDRLRLRNVGTDGAVADEFVLIERAAPAGGAAGDQAFWRR